MKINHLAGAVILLVASTQAPLAVPISGSIGTTGSLKFDTSSPGTATEETGWINPQMVIDTGNFSSIAPGTPITMSSTVWSFNTSTPINNFWTVGGFTFELLSSFIAAQGFSGGLAYLTVDGTGIVSGNGFTPTAMSFNLTTQDPVAGTDGGVSTWSFSASGTTPLIGVADGGSTLMLMGLALTGVAWMSRNRSNRGVPAR